MSADLQPMAAARGSLARYSEPAGAEAVERVRARAEELRGARILHVSSAAPPGRVPELLASSVPLALDAGVEVEWRVLFGDETVGETAAALANGLQGAEAGLEADVFAGYMESCDRVGRAIEAEGFDLVVLHDPGTLGLAASVGPSAWRCHLDCSQADAEALEWAAPLAEECSAVAFPATSFAHEQLARDGLGEVPPGIDPLGPRSSELSAQLAGRVVRPLGVDLGRPFLCQAMRLDRWKDPHATIDAFRLAREEVGELQLVLACLLEARHLDGWRALHEVHEYVGDTPGVILLTSYEGLGSLELGALERLARAGVLRSLREGFGLGASEVMWNRTPVIGTRQGGVPLQVRDGEDGFLADGIEETARRMVELVTDPGLGIDMGRSGHERVRERFLVTRMVEDELKFLARSLSKGGATVDAR